MKASSMEASCAKPTIIVTSRTGAARRRAVAAELAVVCEPAFFSTELRPYRRVTSALAPSLGVLKIAALRGHGGSGPAAVALE